MAEAQPSKLAGTQGERRARAGAQANEVCGVVRVTTFHARAGHASMLRVAADENARAARLAAGCRSAEVCTVPDDPELVVVVSRWESVATLDAFLGWHEHVAHGAVSPHAVEKPTSVHYRVVAGDAISVV